MTFAPFSDVVAEVGSARPKRVSGLFCELGKEAEPSQGVDLEKAAFDRGVEEGRRQRDSEAERWQLHCEAQIAEAVANARLSCAIADVQAITTVIIEQLGQLEARLAKTVLDLLEQLIVDRISGAEREALIATVTRATAISPSATVRISGPEHLANSLASALSLAHLQHEIVSYNGPLKVDIDDARVELGHLSLENAIRGALP